MSSFSEEVPKIARTADVSVAQAAIRSVYGRQASNWLATQAGIAQRTARRWLSPTPPAARRNSITELAISALTMAVTAALFTRATTIDVGEVEVAYEGVSQGWRSIGALKPDDMRPELDGARRELREGNVEEAAYLFSVATLEAYSAGLSDALEIIDYVDGIAVDYA